MITLGFDTSNYTTSVACFDGTQGYNCSRLLDVKPGQLGLRQSDALFSHIKRLPELADRLFVHLDPSEVGAIGVSTRPRAVEGSYMPCFLAGESQAAVLAGALHRPLYRFSHQQGHIAAALWSAKRLELMKRPFLAWHLSGGTTELLMVAPTHRNVDARIIGGTTDLSAGQLIDRTGILLGTAFPAGKALDQMAQRSSSRDCFSVRVQDCRFSFSGLQNKTEAYFAQTGDADATARYALLSVISAVRRATLQALSQYPAYPVVFSGGVASNSLLRSRLTGFETVFAQPEFSTDNAMGIAVLTFLQEDGAWNREF